ncbi:hypothetical protein [Chryseobacterium lathyri]|jgi:hypothetical protein|uniref:Uncharacterized protein n=1 Tax=Chryseobacterium lathyri TaxID=395933 RepID=A0A511YEQ8_9FLAO|nr:hypothetical protein [Chryseobacterium lathyri]GEN73679.1 hypothetical protein CLA01_37510 [Chryseobacterium lathyri]
MKNFKLVLIERNHDFNQSIKACEYLDVYEPCLVDNLCGDCGSIDTCTEDGIVPTCEYLDIYDPCGDCGTIDTETYIAPARKYAIS